MKRVIVYDLKKILPAAWSPSSKGEVLLVSAIWANTQVAVQTDVWIFRELKDQVWDSLGLWYMRVIDTDFIETDQ